MDDIRIDETQEGLIKIDFSHKYLQAKGVTLNMLLLDMNVSRTLIGEVLSDLGYTDTEFEESSFVIDAKLNATDVTFNVYTPHTLTHHPYILDGEEYEVPTDPVGFIVFPDDFLGGICECSGCKHVRRLFETMHIAPYESNVPQTGKAFEFGAYEYIDEEDDNEDDEDSDMTEEVEFFEDIQNLPKSTTMRPVSSIDSDERNADFDIHEELMQTQPSVKPKKQKKPYKPGHVVFVFREIDEVITVAKVLAEVLDEETSLYSFENRYFLVYDLDDFVQTQFREDTIKDISAVNVEHGGKRSKYTKYYLAEYGKEIIETNAFSTLLFYFK